MTSVLPSHLPAAIEMLSDILTTRPFDPDLVDSERLLVHAETAHAVNGYARIMKRMYGNHPFVHAWDSGSRALSRINAEQLHAFGRRVFAPDGIAVAIVGPGVEACVDPARECFGRLRAAGPERLSPPDSVKPKCPAFESTWLLSGQGFVASGFVMPSPLPRRESAALSLFTTGITSPESALSDELRYGAGPAYHFGTSYHTFLGHSLLMTIGTMPQRSTSSFILSVMAALAEIRRRPPDWLEFARQRHLYSIHRYMDVPESVAYRLAWQAQNSSPENSWTITEEIESLERITATEFCEAMSAMFKEDRYFLDYRGRKVGKVLREVRRIIREFT